MKPSLNMPLKPSVCIPWRSDENDQIRAQRVTILACVTLVAVPDANLLYLSVMEACLKRVNNDRNKPAKGIS